MAIEKILNKRSNDVITDGGIETPKKPTSSQLDNGEIAVNYHKGTERLFIKNDNEEVVDFISKDEVEANYYDKDGTDTLLAGKQNTINDLAAIRSGASAGSTAVQPSDLTPIDNRLDNVEYCLGDYLKEIYVFNWENHTTTTTEPIYTTYPLFTVDGNHSFRTFSCRLTADSATISALYLGKLGDTGTMYFTQAGTVTMYLALYSRPSTTDNLIRVYDASGNTVKIISTYEVPYNSQHICTPFTFEVESGSYLKIVTKVAGVAELIWLGQIDFEIAGVKQISKDVHANSAAIEAIEQKIPEQASSSNKLVDKNSLASVATSGSYNDLSDQPTLDDLNKVEDLYALDATNSDWKRKVDKMFDDGTFPTISKTFDYCNLRIYDKRPSDEEYDTTAINSLETTEEGLTFADGTHFSSYKIGEKYYVGYLTGFFINEGIIFGNIEITCTKSGTLKLYLYKCVITEDAYFKINGQPTAVEMPTTNAATILSFDVNEGDVITVSPTRQIDSLHYYTFGLVGMSFYSKYPVSRFANDAGYLTEHQSLTNYYLKSETYSKTEVDNKIGNIETLLATI